MPRLHGVRERRHQPVWDTLVRSTGSPTPAVGPSTRLFGNANVGQLDRTNLQVPGQLASDQTYVILALRAWLYFDGTNHRDLYLQTVSQLYFTLTLGDKPQFVAPCWYFPAGGGIAGFDAADSVLNNGDPSQTAILKLARPIIIPVRQNISVNAEFFAVGTTNVLDLINGAATDDQMVIMYLIDGLQTRDAQ
ncbi:MAG: hypothetical protein IT338_17185 [Thermomicrobiales bacterium]|nr:hypothetical protein [Thermomicrobiales bacterium]